MLYPFIVVLIHTYIDTLRNDDEREIKHHGKTIQVQDENENIDLYYLQGNACQCSPVIGE